MPYPGLLHPEPLPLWQATADTQTHKRQVWGLSLFGVSWCVLGFVWAERLWWVWGLILNMISPPPPPFCWGFYFALGCGVSFFGGVQHSPINSCSAASCNLGVLAGEHECMSFYSFVLFVLDLNWKKVGKTTRPFRYDLNQIPWNYTLEVTNRFKGLHLIDRVPEELWMQLCDIVLEGVIKTIPEKKKCKMAALQIAEKRREVKGKGEKERYTHLNAEF